MAVCLGEGGKEVRKWEGKDLTQRAQRTQSSEKRKSSDEEVEDEEKEADQKKYGTAIDATARKAA